ncbi:MAG: asparaginase [Actinomycetota bacterium]|nr:asparaginase [Actinomycetota bacterium]
MPAGRSSHPVSAGAVVLYALGGTISMAGDGGGGVVARLSGADLLEALSGLDDIAIEARDTNPIPSADLTFADILEVVAEASAAVDAGARGVVLTQGTDTLEETAFLIDCLWRHREPFVISGAMRNPTLPGADGPANLSAAMRVAATNGARELGALVVFNDEIHSARHVRKTHSTSPATFRSPDAGPIGHVVEGVARVLVRVPRFDPLPVVMRSDLATTSVALHTATIEDDYALLTLLADGCASLARQADDGGRPVRRGLVVAGLGAGHVRAEAAEILGRIAQSMPVVLTSRTGAGSILSSTYGAAGAERDLLARGLIGGGFLHPYKARVLLRLLIAAGAGPDEIEGVFNRYR